MSALRHAPKPPRDNVAWIGPARCATVRLAPPPLPRAKLRRILPALLGQHIPFPVEECDIAFEPLPDGAEMGFAARRSAVDAALAEQRASTGTEPVHLVPAAWALWRASQRALPPVAPDERRAVLCGVGDALIALVGQGDALTTSAELPADAAALALGSNSAGLRCLCVGDRAAVIADAARAAGAVPVVPADAADFLAAACAEAAARRNGADLLAGRAARAPSPRFIAGAATLLLVASAALILGTTRALNRARGHAADLSDELAARVDAIAGYHVAAKGERAVAIARRAAAEGDASADAQALARLLRPAASTTLSDTLKCAAAHGIHVFHLAVDDIGPALSGDAPDRASADAFAAELLRLGHPVRLEPEPGPRASGERLRFMATPLSSPTP